MHRNAGIAQLVEQLICNQQVGGSSPSTSSTHRPQLNMEEFPSGQRGQTVNLLSMTSVVRIHPPPPKSGYPIWDDRFFAVAGIGRTTGEISDAPRAQAPRRAIGQRNLCKRAKPEQYGPNPLALRSQMIFKAFHI